MVAQELAERWELKASKDRFNSQLAEGRPPAHVVPPGGERPHVVVMRPQTYYNDAGRAVGPARGSFKLALERVLVVHDEIDLPFGEVRTRLGGGLAGNNGLKSIKAALGGPEFMRVRVGVGRPDSTDPEIVAGWVLGRFAESAPEVAGLIARGREHVERAVLGGGDPAGGDPAGGDTEKAADAGSRR